jgi:hypothetical protein
MALLSPKVDRQQPKEGREEMKNKQKPLFQSLM